MINKCRLYRTIGRTIIFAEDWIQLTGIWLLAVAFINLKPVTQIRSRLIEDIISNGPHRKDYGLGMLVRSFKELLPLILFWAIVGLYIGFMGALVTIIKNRPLYLGTAFINKGNTSDDAFPEKYKRKRNQAGKLEINLKRKRYFWIQFALSVIALFTIGLQEMKNIGASIRDFFIARSDLWELIKTGANPEALENYKTAIFYVASAVPAIVILTATFIASVHVISHQTNVSYSAIHPFEAQKAYSIVKMPESFINMNGQTANTNEWNDLKLRTALNSEDLNKMYNS